MPQTVENINGIDNPSVGFFVATDVTLVVMVITSIYRYNGSGRWTCGLKKFGDDTITATMDVYKKNGNWSAKEYVPERYRDEEGVLKQM